MLQVDPKTDLDELVILQNKNAPKKALLFCCCIFKKSTQSKEYGR